MSKVTRQKQERVIEALRHGLEGDAAAEFVRQSGYAMSIAGIARHLRAMGGRAALLERIQAGQSNREILEACFPGEVEEEDLPPPSQGELFTVEQFPVHELSDAHIEPGFEATKITLKIPNDLYEAIGFAAKGEGKTRAQLIIDILGSALSHLPPKGHELPEE